MGNVIDLDNAFDEFNMVFIIELLIRGFSKLVTKEVSTMDKTSVSKSSTSQVSEADKGKAPAPKEDDIEILRENPVSAPDRAKTTLPSFKKNKRARHKSPIPKVHH